MVKKYFSIKNYNFGKDIISSADLSISNGGLYEKLGFKFLHVSDPGYRYKLGDKLYHRSMFMKHKLVEYGFDSEMTEKQIMEGVLKVYNTGNLQYIYKNNLKNTL